MLASYRGHVETVELLLHNGSDVNLTTEVHTLYYMQNVSRNLLILFSSRPLTIAWMDSSTATMPLQSDQIP